MRRFSAPLAVACTTAGILLLASGVASGRQTVIPVGNLLQNPGAEASVGSATGSGPPAPIPSWTTAVQKADSPVKSGFMVVQYGASGFPDKPAGAKITGGANFFGGGDSTELSSASQTVDVSQAATEIDAGQVSANLAADLGGYSSQDDNGTVSATFLDANGGALGTVSIGPVTEAQRAGVTELLFRSTTGLAPKGTRSIRVTMSAKRFAGSWDDAYFDNIDLGLTKAVPPHPSLRVRCSGKRLLTATVAPATGLKSVVFSVRRLRKPDAKAPFAAHFSLATLPHHLSVKAAVMPISGSPIVLTKKAPC